MKRIIICLCLIAASTAQGQWGTIEAPLQYEQVSGAGNFSKVYIAGGYDYNGNYHYIVREYDRITETWDDDPSLFLSTGRIKVATAIAGDRLFCAGGWVWPTEEHVGSVEVFDLTTGSLLQEDQLSQARVEIATAVVGNKVIFAGGHQATWNGADYTCIASDVIDIFDLTSNTWSTATLSQARAGMASAVLDGKAYFAGGYRGSGVGVSDRVDIYDAVADSWSTATLSQARALYGGGVTVGGRVMFAGGIIADNTCSETVDIYDPAADAWSTHLLIAPRFGVQAASVGNYAIFAGGGCGVVNWYYTTGSDAVDVYDAANDTWSIANMSHSRINFLAAASGNQVFLVGGYDFTNDVVPMTVDVFTDASTIGIEEASQPMFSAWPNPFTDRVTIGSLEAAKGCALEVFDVHGKLVVAKRLVNTLVVDLGHLPGGAYEIRLTTLDGARNLGRANMVKMP
ncbi:MAG: T9SS type A sorting domain-containing protein [Flavobacteriales bacterium]|nr:T9SS type A sorting domain-containing protein [Flavobacteriales bacterium]